MTDRKNYDEARERCESIAKEIAAKRDIDDSLLSHVAALTGALASELEMTICDYNLLLVRYNALLESSK
jgi:hypothetical protein